MMEIQLMVMAAIKIVKLKKGMNVKECPLNAMT